MFRKLLSAFAPQEGKHPSLRTIKEAGCGTGHEQASTRVGSMTLNPPNIDPMLAEHLRGVLDPEIGINIVDLGLVYSARKTNEAVEIRMTLTSRACPMGAMVVEDVRHTVAANYPGATRVDVELVWDPAWNPDLMSDAARLALGRPPTGH
jgi:metal-sulfur cluster biosynthetic enzyme